MPRIRVTLAVAASLLLLGAPGAGAAPPTVPLAECADTVTTADIFPGDDAVGFTVREGEAVESFDVEILGIYPDALAPGRDLVVVETAGPVIDAGGGGISAGMSGSPVYTMDGELIGAISYGFSYSPSSIGGVTPADPDMLNVLGEPATKAHSASSPKRIPLSGSLRTRVAKRTDAPSRALDQGLTQLKVPFAVSGATTPARLGKVQRRVDRKKLPLVVTPGASAPLGAPLATIAPGDPFAAALSYGDVTFAGIGTATYVCDGRAVAFGHPFFFSGPAQMGASRASVLAIVDDVFGPYKLAVPTDPVGLVDRDRLSAIRARLGQQPPTVQITQDTTALDTGNTRLGSETDAVQPVDKRDFWFGYIALTHAYSNIDSTFDQISGGSSLVKWKIDGVHAKSGRPWSITRSNRFTSNYDISFGSVFELEDALSELQRQDLANIEFTGVDIDVEVERAISELKIDRVRWARNDGPFEKAKRMAAKPGDEIHARIELKASDDHSHKKVEMTFHVPRSDRGGLIRISGGEDGGHRHRKAKSFGDLLDRIEQAPRNQDLTGTAEFGRHDTTITRAQDRVVTGSKALRVIVRRGDGGSDIVVPLAGSAD
jgi:hypothetical protein